MTGIRVERFWYWNQVTSLNDYFGHEYTDLGEDIHILNPTIQIVFWQAPARWGTTLSPPLPL